MLVRKSGVKPATEDGREVRHFRVEWLGLLPGNSRSYILAYADSESETGESQWLADYAATDPGDFGAWAVVERPGEELWVEACGWFGSYQYLEKFKLYWKPSPDAVAG